MVDVNTFLPTLYVMVIVYRQRQQAEVASFLLNC